MYGFEKLQIDGMQPSLLANKLRLAPKTLELFFSKIKVSGKCWEWMGARRQGYGAVKIRAISTSTLQAHRIAYQLVNGYVESEFPLHHLVENGCMGPSCCNPDHLQKTTTGEHSRDLTPGSASYIAAHRNTCAQGHPYTAANTRIVKGGFRQCRECDKQRKQCDRDALRGDRVKFKKSELAEFCLRGHAMEGDNLYFYETKNGPQRRCRACCIVRDEERKSATRKVDPTKTHCINGHPMEGDNLRFRPNGYATCKACALEGVKRHQANNREEVLLARRQARLARKLAAAEEAKEKILAIFAANLPEAEMIAALRAALPPAEA